MLMVVQGCHHGIDQTIYRLRSKFYWPRTCLFVKPKFINSALSPMVTKASMEVIAMDFIWPLPISNGYKYLSVVVYCFFTPFSFFKFLGLLIK